MAIGGLVALIIYLVLIGLAIYVLRWVLEQLKLPEPVRIALMLIVALVFLLWLLGQLGLM
jgi:hypothetical protein